MKNYMHIVQKLVDIASNKHYFPIVAQTVNSEKKSENVMGINIGNKWWY